MRIFKIIKGILAELGSIRVLLTSILEETEALSGSYLGLGADIKILKQLTSEMGASVTNSGNSLVRFLQEQKTVKEIEADRLEEILEDHEQKPTPHDLIF